ncbi:HEPN domain-containing protein [Cyanobium sp. AMD-g]|uniref:HEPN domain-containing protein n=1 Tax=Cyanobium sp. AMD-g TaxID=2823699 RepID=UPI0020CC514B|nr:HEPN domain-containing protein [Cyanobium sp. AMD-g]MCP9931165.1 HEPN domain-containing protein [Cyanobium sp. AMD-g]
MTPRVEAGLRQADNDLAMAGYAVDGGFHAQACYHASQEAEKALKAILISLDSEPRQTHALEALVSSLAAAGVPTEPLTGLRLNALSRMNSATRYPDGDQAPSDLFDRVDADMAIATAKNVLAFVHSLMP